MPYRKRRYNKKKCAVPMFGKADRYVARQALYLGKKAISMMNVEYKCLDVSPATFAAPDGPGRITQLTNIAQGDTAVTRDGNQIKLTAINFKAIITCNVSATTIGSTINCYLIEDRQTNGAIYASADLLASVVNTTSLVTPLNIDNKFRFRVLKRWIVHVNNEGHPRQTIKYYHQFGNQMKLRFDSNNGDITDLTSRSLSFLAIGNEAVNEPTVTMFSRLRFVDN